jgi:hypothetical chaperone protein
MHASPARACGIDFGTSNSTVGWLRPGQPTLLTLEDGKPTLPSVVFFNAEADTVSVGRNGLSEYLAGYRRPPDALPEKPARQQPDRRPHRS